MRKILSSRIFRILVCFVLICCFLVNLSPIKAEATGLVEGIAVAPLPVSVKVVAAAALICLGIMAVSESNAFDNAVDNFANFLSETTSYVVDGMVNVFGVVGSDGLVRSYLPLELLESGLYWAFDSGVVSANTVPNYDGDVSSWSDVISYAASQPYAFLVKFSNGSQVVGHSGGGFIVVNKVLYPKKGSTFFMCRLSSDGLVSSWGSSGYLNIYDSDVSYFGTFIPEYTSTDGLTLGRIQAPVEEVAFGDLEAYSAYAGGAISLPGVADDEEKLHLPVRIPGLEYNDDVITQTQEEAQTGVTDLEFVFTGDDVVGDDTITDSGSITWQPPSDMGKFTLDLKQYFPFCIPFDLHAFFTCLNAEPVAPVIEWIIPLPGGKTYPFEIDLSAFDSVAQILRRMQLLLFCVGLAFKTRDLIKG